MRKMVIVLAVLGFGIGGAGAAFTQSMSDEHGSQSVDQIMGQIRSELKLGQNDRIDPNQVPSTLMIKLGDAVMDVMIPNQQQHEYMDQMMGGEGSASLDSMHEWIAYRYLTGGYNANGVGYGMMPGGMMGYRNGGWGMMGNPNVPYGSSLWLSPEQIAKQRYAQGQITRQQYEQILKDLQQAGGSEKN